MRLVAIFVWAAVCFLTGCGTLARVGSYGDPSSLHSEFTAFYPATDYDLVAISTGGRDWLAGHHADTVSGWNLALVVPLHILDLPISLATDTLCLPWDIVVAIESHKEQTTPAPSAPPSFAVSQLKGRVRSSSGHEWHDLRMADELRAGCLVQTSAGLDDYMDISLRRSVTVRVYPGSLVAITDVTQGHEGVGGDAALALRVGKIRVKAEPGSTCEVALTNGIVRISGGLACLYERGDVNALNAAVLLTLKGQSEPSKVPPGYRFEAASGKLYELRNVH
jgi:uncharacterized protein YceK